MTIRLLELRRTDKQGTVEVLPFDRHLTLLRGLRNSGKTTILRTIDYCLGSTDTAAEAIGSEVADRYVLVELAIALNDQSHLLRRSLDRQYGQLTRIIVDGVTPLTPPELTRWIMDALQWPQLDIPKGRNDRYARELTPLTFRTLLRHIYRREDSWMEFAQKEEEFHRRAVTAFFLGLAEDRYSNVEYDIGQAERAVAEWEGRYREVNSVTSSVLVDVLRSLGLPTDRPDVAQVVAELDAERQLLNVRRDGIAATIGSTTGYDPELTTQLQTTAGEIERRSADVSRLRNSIQGYRDAQAAVRDELQRLERALVSIDTFADLPVRVCPACEQSVDSNGQQMTRDGACYLCSQPVTPDARRRRLEIERVTLSDELSELRQVIDRTSIEQTAVESVLVELEQRRESLSGLLNDRRASIVAPFVAELERLSGRLASIAKEQAALQGLRGLATRADAIAVELQTARDELNRAEQRGSAVARGREVAAERCGVFADRMNRFLLSIQSDPWTQGLVTLNPTEMRFYIGTRPWDQILGGESRVLFFFAYHYALLFLPQDVGSGAHAPGLALLDNPIQQGLPDFVISEVLNHFRNGCEACDGQIVASVARAIALDGQHGTVDLVEQYGGG